MHDITYANVLQYTSKFYPNTEAKLLQDIAFYNKTDINYLIYYIKTKKEKPIEISINSIRKKLKKKYKKFVISRNNNIGNLYTFGANIDETNEQKIFIVPYGEFKDNPNAYIEFRYFKRDKFLNNFLNKLFISLKTSKVTFNTEIINRSNNFYIRLTVDNPLLNETFWGVVRLWASH